MPTTEIAALYAHMEWADETLWEAVLGLDAAPEDRGLRELLVHVHTVQWVYLGLWRGEPFSPPETADRPERQLGSVAPVGGQGRMGSSR